MSSPRFVVIYANNARDLQEKLDGYTQYDVIQMSSGPWFGKSGLDNTLEQIGDSIYVLLELKTPDVVINMTPDADPKPDPPGRCGRRHKR